MKNLLSIVITLVLFSSLMSCGGSQKRTSPKADKLEQIKTEQSLAQAYKEVGMPAIVNFKEKKDLKDLYELRDKADLVCYAYLMNERTGHIGQFLGKCLGYGISASTQFSNPEKVSNMRGDYGQYADDAVYTIGQAEPNGLFMPEGLSATWLKLIDPKTGKASPVYIEPAIIVSPFKLH